MRRSLLATSVAICATALVTTAPAGAAAGWTQVSAPTPHYGGGLTDISCPSASVCVAVGVKSENSNSSRVGALVERWNGSTVQMQKDPAGTAMGVSCVRPGFCMEVGIGSYTAASGTSASAARWNGTRWRALTMPAARDSYLDGVSCWSRKGCVAVGQTLPVSYARPLIERWNGTTWRIQKSPTGSQYANHLVGVSCVSGTNCIAVGQTFLDAQGRDSRTLAEKWNGHRWRLLSPPTLRKSTQPGLDGISCFSGQLCIAVGGSDSRTLIVRWTGSGFVKQTPAPTPARSNAPTLSGVSCPTATFCMAVGTSQFPAGLRAEQWDGSSWTMTTLPGSGSANDVYDSGGVSCPDTTTCLADGSYQHHTTEHVILDRWSSS